ncbi:MAG: hypothetical protein J6N49_05660 [Alphaproteobacteria bacterium]|nr:hypothetical protein [Alphaproteobacteria bacterium]
MKKSVVVLICLCCCLLQQPAVAQTFSVGSSVGNNTSLSQTNGKNPVATKATVDAKKAAAKIAESSVPSPEKDKGDFKDEQLQKSIKNIGNERPSYSEKKYDNRAGSVFTFRMKDGKIEFEDNTDRKVLVWYENYNVIKGMDGMVRCSIRVYVFNDMVERISSLGFKIIWPGISAGISMNKVNPGVRTHVDTLLLGDGCFTMDKTPVIEVNRCRVRGMSEDKCADAVHWFNRH